MPALSTTAVILLCIALVYAAASVASFVAYWMDKRAARAGKRRVRERTLHVLELLGGWPGALIAQRVLRHKTQDRAFLFFFWAIVILHAAAAGLAVWWFWLRA